MNSDAGAESEGRGSFKDVRESTLELPTPPTLPRPQQPSRHIPGCPGRPSMQNPLPHRFPGGPRCPHRRRPAGTEGRAPRPVEEELVQGEIEGVFELPGF